MRPFEVMMGTLRRAVSLKRPHGSKTEGQFLLSLIPTGLDSWVDGAGNLHVDLREDHGHRTLFVAHTDTVHRYEGPNEIDTSTSMWCTKLPLSDPNSRQPLGADDGAGVAILRGMIAAGKPGYYIFTRGEECGGLGARYLAAEQFGLLASFDRAIAFDRKSTWSVITHQNGGRCCSDEFALALADQLNQRGLLYGQDDTGVYTDTAEFVGVIPECTNLSAGYDHEHSGQETLDVEHVQHLFEAALLIDWDMLPTVREPEDEDETGPVYWDLAEGDEDSDDDAHMSAWDRPWTSRASVKS